MKWFKPRNTEKMLDLACAGDSMKELDIKIREIKGYHKLAKDLRGWNGSIECLMKDVEFHTNKDCFRMALTMIELHRGRRVLDFGAGNCWASYALSKLGYDVVALDMNASNICGLGTTKEWRKKTGIYFAAVLGDCEYVPFKKECFDIAFCHHTLHHAYDLGKMVQEISNTVKPGGLIIAASEHTRPIFRSDKKFRESRKAVTFGVNEHAYSIREYRDAFKKADVINIKVLSSRGWDKMVAARSTSPLKDTLRKLIRSSLRIPVLRILARRTFLALLFANITIYGIKGNESKSRQIS